MIRALLIVVGVGVLLNALTFLMVAHYFSKEKEKPVAAASAKSSAPAQEAPPHPEILRRLTSLESNMNSIVRKIDGIAARATAPAASPSPPRSQRNRTPGLSRNPLPGEPGAGEPEDVEPTVEEQPPPPPAPPAREKKEEGPAAPEQPGPGPLPEGQTPQPGENADGGSGANPEGGPPAPGGPGQGQPGEPGQGQPGEGQGGEGVPP